MKLNGIYLALMVVCGIRLSAQAQQTPQKITFTGAARGQFYGDHFSNASEADTVTTAKTNSGHVMADVGIHIRPNDAMEIQGMVRVRNDYGGFWGSGVSFDIRQLYIKGVAGGVVKYQLGDINYKLTPFTLYNNNQEIYDAAPLVFKQQMDVINYDHFYNADQSWRQQGASAEFGLSFAKSIQALQFRTVGTRLKTSDFGQTNDRVLLGLNAEVIQSDALRFGLNHVIVTDILGTSRNPQKFQQPVTTLTMDYQRKSGFMSYTWHTEAGLSGRSVDGDSTFTVRNGRFIHTAFTSKEERWGLSLTGGWSYVSADFRSIGAQTKRINFNAELDASQRIGNDQHLRPLTLADMLRESNMCTMQLQSALMPVSKTYDNITPYGDATPNRQGFQLNASLKPKLKSQELFVHAWLGSETRGEGTNTLRQFQRFQFKWSRTQIIAGRKNTLSLFGRQDHTQRPGEEKIPAVDLTTRLASLGWECEISDGFQVMLGWMWLQAKGFDFLSQRALDEQVVTFQEWTVNTRQQIAAAGLRYTFNERSFLTVQYQQAYHRSQEANNQYGLSQWMLLYQITF
ncbi:MAG: hypothetical protein ACKO6L_01200 [Flavobacteriales bacterium]